MNETTEIIAPVKKNSTARYKKPLINFFIFILCLTIAGALGINNHVEWDFINYKYCNGWEFINNRIDTDILPSVFRSYFNPILDTCTYYLIEKLNNHPHLFLFISGMKLGCFTFLTYILTNFILNNKCSFKNFMTFTIILATIFSPIIPYSNNYGCTDLQPACLVLLGIYLWLRTILKEKTFGDFVILFLGAFLIGLATGLKYPHGIFGACIFFGTILFRKNITNYIKCIFVILFGLILGFLVTNGYWMLTLYTHFNNPFFPYFNWLFPHSIDQTSSIFSTDFAHIRPNNIFQYLFMPLINPSHGNIGSEWGFFDFKIHLCFFCIIAHIILNKKYHLENKIIEIIKPIYLDIIIFIVVFAYYTNLFLFGQIRYVISVFPLASIIIFTTITNYFNMNKKSYPDISKIIFVMIFLYFVLGLPTESPYQCTMITLIVLYSVIIFLSINSNISKNKTYTTISLIILSIFFSYKFIPSYVTGKKYSKIITVENAKIKDNANVIIGTMASNYIIPKQNPKAKYIGFAIPKNFETEGYYYSFFPNRYAKSAYLEGKLKKIFKENKDLYFIYSSDGTNYENDLNVYIKSIQYYSNNKIKNLKNCKPVQNKLLYNENYNKVYICKLK